MTDISFFYTTFQENLEQVEALMSKEADPSRPYDWKYQAREILEALIKNEELNQNTVISKCARALTFYLSALNHFETEEITESDRRYNESLQIFKDIPSEFQAKYATTLQDIYNSIGILATNRGDDQIGMQNFQKAEMIYNLVQPYIDEQFTSNFHDYLHGWDSEFRFIIDGGVNKRKAEQNFTLTLFYKAQAYSKTQEKQKAAYYCSETMRRQIEFGDYETKDWCVNAINMAEYYSENHYLSQAVYTLQCAMSLLTVDQKRKLRSTLHMQLGRCYVSVLQLGVAIHREQAEIPSEVYEQCMLFNKIQVEWKPVEPPLNLETAKEIFRIGLNHFNSALEYFIIDGYVTEHVEMKKDISELYKWLIYFEESEARVVAMLNKRLELLEEFTKDLNKQAYSQLWQKLMNEVATIYVDIYETKLNQLRQKKRPKNSLQDKVNMYAITSIEKQTELLEFIEKFEMNNDTAVDIIQSTLNLMFGIARIYGKLESNEREKQISFMERSLRWYERTKNFLIQTAKGQYASRIPDFEEHVRIAEEMVGLLPVRIGQVNAEMLMRER